MSIAKSATIYPLAKIIHNGTNFSLGEFSRIDDFVFLNAGKNCTLGKFVHICSFVSIIGGGEFCMGDFSGLCAGCRIITGSDDFTGPFMTNSTVPEEFTHVETSHVTIGKHVIIGTNTVIFPGVTIGDGAAIGAGCFVRTDLKPWGIYAGSNNFRKTGERDRDAILEKERRLLEKMRSGQIG